MPNTVEILLSINQNVKTIVESMAPKNGDGPEATAKLSRGNVSTTSDVNPAKATTPKTDLSKEGLSTVITFLNSVSPSILAISKLSNSNIRRFSRVMDAIVSSIKKISEVSKTNQTSIKAATDIIKTFDIMVNGIKKMPAFIVTAPLAMLGLTMAKGVFRIYDDILNYIGNIKSVSEKIKNLNMITKSIDSMVSFVMKGALMLTVCMGMGLLVAMGPTKELILGGLAVFGAVLVATAAIITVVGLTARLMRATDAIQSMKMITDVVLTSILVVTACIGLGYLVANSETKNIMVNGLVVLGFVLLTMTGLILLTGLASRIINGVGAINAIKSIVMFTLATMGIIILAYGLSLFIEERKEGIKAGLIATGEVMLGLIGMFGLFSLVSRLDRGGDPMKSVGSIILLTFGAMAIVVASYYLSEFVKDKTDEIKTGLLLTAGVMTGLIGIGWLAGKMLSSAKQGIIALAVLELLAAGAIGVTSLLLKMEKNREESGITWGDLFISLGLVTSIVVAFGGLAVAAGALIVPIGLGIPGMVAVTLFATKMIDVINSLIDVTKRLDEIGGSEVLKKTLQVDIPNILKGIRYENFKVDMTRKQIRELGHIYKDVAKMVTSVLTVVESISKISQVCGIIDTNGNIRPVLNINKDTGVVTYGEPVNLVNVATVITRSVKTFVDNFQFGIKEVGNMMSAKAIVKILASLIDPITKFVEMLTGYQAGDNNTLARMIVDADGNIKPSGTFVNVIDVAGTIAGAITTFVKALYSEENKGTWAELVYGDRTFWQRFTGKSNDTTRALSQVAGILGAIMDPVCSFVDLISMLEPEGNKIRRLIIDSNGNVKRGEAVDLTASSTLISGAISSFATHIFKGDYFKDINEDSIGLIEKMIKPIDSIVKMSIDISSNKIDTKTIEKNSTAIATANMTIIKSMSGANNEEVDKFVSNLKNLKTAFSDLDSVLINDDERRQRALEKFDEKIKSILSTISGSKDSIDSFRDMMNSVQNSPVENQSLSITASDIEESIRNVLDGMRIRSDANVGSDNIEDIMKNMTYTVSI